MRKTILLSLLSVLFFSCTTNKVETQEQESFTVDHPITMRARGFNAEIATYKNLSLSELGFLLKKLAILEKECGDIVCLGLVNESRLKVEKMIKEEIKR